MTRQKLDKAQLAAMELFQEYWGKFLVRLGRNYFGDDAPNLLKKGEEIATRIEDKLFEEAARQCRGALNHNALVGLFGRICGDQFGRQQIARDAEFDNEFPTQAARMFESAYRVGYEELMARSVLAQEIDDIEEVDGPKIIVPRGGIN